MPSNGSIKSTDVECLEKLQELAEAELSMKRQIADLERREEAYMRTLQQADELWAKLEEDAASSMSGLQEQLETKTAANQQMANLICQLEDKLEKLGSKLATCKDELGKYLSIRKIEAIIGGDDDFATVSDSAAVAGVKKTDTTTPTQPDMVDEIEALKLRLATCTDELEKFMSIGKIEALIGRDDDFATVSDTAAAADVPTRDTTTVAHPDVHDAGLDIRPEDFAREEDEMEEVKKLLAQLDSLSELDGPGSFCTPDFDCNDLQLSATGLTEEEKLALQENRVTARELLEKCGLLEIAEQMADEPVQYRVVAKSAASESLAATSARQAWPSRTLTEEDLEQETLEREILYDDLEPGRIDDEDELDDRSKLKEMVSEKMENASVPLSQLLNWQNMVHFIRSKIAVRIL